jgi:amino-acid N-acetyltransferase
MSTSAQVRPATPADIAGIQILLKHYAKSGDLLPRSKQELTDNIDHFRVINGGSQIIACGSLEHFSQELAEVRSLVVSDSHKGQNLGRIIVEDIIDAAKQRKVERLMALTYLPKFFQKLGFRIVSKEIFPEKIWGICVNCYKFHNCDEIAVLLEL